MIKKKTLINLITIPSVIVAAGAVAAGFMVNEKNNQYQKYYTAPLSTANTDLINAYFSAVVNGSKLLYLASYTHTAPITQALNVTKESNEVLFRYLNKAGYILIDDTYGLPSFKNGLINELFEQYWSTNVASVQFRADLGSFVTGIALAEFLNENQHYFGKNLTWATYGGMAFPTVTSFMGGLQKGVDFFNKYIQPKVNGYVKVEQKVLGSEYTENFSGTFDPNGGISIINRFLGSKNTAPSVFIPIAGAQTQQAVRKIKQDGLRTVVIGVDSPIEDDQTINLSLEPLSDNSLPGNGKIIQFSTIKNVNIMASKVTTKINEGTIDVSTVGPEQYIGGLGYSSLGNLANDGVGVSPAGYQYFIKAMKLFKNPTNKDSILNESYSNLEENEIMYKQELNDPNNIEFQNALISMNLTENKIFIVKEQNGTIVNNPHWENGDNSYASIPNTGQWMLPIASDELELRQWYIDSYNNDELIMNNIEENIKTIKEWQLKNKNTIKARKGFNLKNQLTKQAYENNNSIIKIIFQSSNSILFDHSFLQSCYLGLIQYWQSKGIELPKPPISSGE